MNTRPNQDRPAAQASSLLTPADLTDPEKLIIAAQEHFATRFPNPRRVGCPAPGVIQTFVQSERLPDDELRAHLFGCSECFDEYRAAVIAQRQSPAAKMPAGWRQQLLAALGSWRRPVFARACALLLLAAVVFTWRTQRGAPQLSQTRPQPASTAPASAERVQPEVAGAVLAEPSPQATDKLMPAPHTQKAADQLLAVNFDLNDHRSLGAQSRSSAVSETNRPILLPRVRFRLTLQLRDNSAPGSYRVSILDSSERRRATALARSHHGQMLQVTLDLRRVLESKATLRLERSDQPDVAPEDYRAEIVRP